MVTTKDAALWTDGRYFLQAESQLDENWTLMRDGVKGTPTRGEWLADKLEPGQAVGVDPYLVPCPEWEALEGTLRAGDVSLRPVSDNLVDRVWGGDQPERPENPVLPLEESFAGRSWEDKVSAAREAMREKRAHCLVLSALDEVAWMLNLRGSDIAYNPVFFAYLMLTSSSVYLFISEGQVSDAIKKHLRGKVSVHVRAYSDVSAEVDKYAAENPDKKVTRSRHFQHILNLNVIRYSRHTSYVLYRYRRSGSSKALPKACPAWCRRSSACPAPVRLPS